MSGALREIFPPGSAARELLEHAGAVLNRQFAVPFCYYELASLEPVIEGPPAERLPVGVSWLTESLSAAAVHADVLVRPLPQVLQALVIPFGTGRPAEFAAVGIFAVRPLLPTSDAGAVARLIGANFPLDRIPYCEPELLRRLGAAALAALADRRQLRSREAELIQLAAHVARNYEEITLLHQLTRDAQISQGTRAVQELALTLLAEVLPARQIAYVRPADQTVISAGQAVLDSNQCCELVRRLADRAAGRALVENHLDRSELAGHFVGLQRLVVVPVAQGNDPSGWLVALNTVDGSELGSVEASLMSAVAAILATHQTNVTLFQNVEDLFLGVVRALSSAIDAKDPYTCGHSERVAQVARRLGQELGLSEPELNQLYLSGLLHDVGKIGIRDAVLLKSGLLTPEETRHMQQHPRIGYEILSGVRQLQHVLPGVRNHHEHFDGTGYPDALKEQEIPLLARILAVADAYDAMSSDRPYRKGLSSEKIEQIFADGAGKQWDSRVVTILLRIHGQMRQTLGTPIARPPTEGADQPGFAQQVEASGQGDLRRISRFFALAGR